MSYSAQVFRILIASPSDVAEEREIAVRTIQEWNDLNSSERQLVLLPLRWETHSAPEYGKRPQEVINRQVVDQCDLLVGVFWTRIGSPTGVADSGTLEEIERVAKDGKPIMLYFSKTSKNPDDIDLVQLEKLREFKKKTFPKALVESYSGAIEFRDKLSKQLEIQLRSLLVESGGLHENANASPFTDVILNFADEKTGEPIGENIELNSAILVIVDYDKIPEYTPKMPSPKSEKEKEFVQFLVSMRDRGKDYYKNKIDKIINKSKFKPIRFWLKNSGTIGARDVFIDIVLKSNGSKISLQQGRGFETDEGIILVTAGDESSGSKQISDTIWKTSLEMRALQPKREVSPSQRILLSAD